MMGVSCEGSKKSLFVFTKIYLKNYFHHKNIFLNLMLLVSYFKIDIIADCPHIFSRRSPKHVLISARFELSKASYPLS